MISVIEPLCKNITHERLNKAILYYTSIFNKKDNITFYADKSHIKIIKDSLEFKNVSYKKILLNFFPSYFSIIFYLIFLFFFIKENKDKKIIFLSFDNYLLISLNFLIKYIYKKKKLKIYLVIHGLIEEIKEKKNNNLDLPIKKNPFFKRNFYKIFKLNKLIFKFLQAIKYICSAIFFFEIINNLNNIKKTISRIEKSAFIFISLSKHATKALKNQSVTKNIKIKTITFPFLFYKNKKIKNKFLKFAVYGHGQLLLMNNLINYLNNSKINKPYQFKIISMNQNLLYNKNLILSKNLPMSSYEMDSLSNDVDFFIILYEKEEYRFCCSASIIEAIRLEKPILYLDNPCINSFDSKKFPLGIRCRNLEQLSKVLVNNINFYEEKQKLRFFFKTNIKKLKYKMLKENAKYFTF